MKKWIASSLTAALIVVSPGLPFYASASEIVGPESSSGARTPITPVIPVVPQNLEILQGAQGLPINGAPVIVPEGISGGGVLEQQRQTPAESRQQTRSAQADETRRAETRQTQVVQAQLLETSRQTTQVNKALESRGGETTAKSESGATFGEAGAASGKLSEPVAGSESAQPNDLSVFAPQRGAGSLQPPSPPSRGSSSAPQGKRGSKLLGFVKSVAIIGAVGAAVVGLQMGGVALLPAVFGLIPEAAAWSVASGILPPLLLAGLYARYRLSKRDSPRLAKVKVVLDVSIGAFLGALAVAAPAFSFALAAQGLGSSLPLLAAAGIGTAAASATRGSAVNTLLGGAALLGIPALVGVGAHGLIGLAPIVGMLALPAMTTITFFLGSLINSAESGRPFEVPGSMQKMRFPSFNWVMIGVVFALVTGYSAVYTNLAFFAWMFLGSKDKKAGVSEFLAPRVFFAGTAVEFRTPGIRIPPVVAKILNFILDFDHLFLGVVAIAALTGFSSPLTFLALAFAPERAAVWTERLLARFLPGGKPAPSTGGGAVDERSFADKLETKVPNMHHWIKTGLILAVMAGSVGLGAFALFSVKSLISSAIPALILTALPFIFSAKLVKAVMKAEPASESNMPKPYFDAYMRVSDRIFARINAKRRAKGQKPIKMAERTRVPMDIPNAFATGRDPNHALIGVTDGIMDMLLDSENVRDQLGRLIGMFEKKPDDPKFKVFRAAIAGSVKGLSETASPAEVAQAVQRASPEELRALGERMLEGVLAHEFSHVMDRHMLTGSIAGFFSSVFAFASYGIMWGVGHAQVAAKKAAAKLFGKTAPPAVVDSTTNVSGGSQLQGVKPEVVEPLSTGVALKSLPALLKVLAALWGPVILQLTQMAGSRNNESQADFDGALLIEDPASLALALGMLMTWRPRGAFFIFRGRRFEGKDLPLLAAVAPMFTVNPLQQLSGGGAADALTKSLASKQDNFLFNLFVTHPDTGWRIETLWRILQGLRAQRARDGGGGGVHDPPLAFVAPDQKNAPATRRGGSFRGAWERVTGLFRVLPDKDRNRQFWKYVWGQALINVGISFHYSSLGKLSDPTDKQPERVNYNRAANAGAQLGSSLLTGPLVDRSSVQKVLRWTYLGRALFLLAIPMIFFAGHGVLPFIAFQLLIFGAGFLQSTSATAASVAFNRILAQDTASYNKANAIYNVVTGLAGIVAPLAAGAFIAAMNARYGLLSGNALSYAVYGLLLLGTVWLYRTMKLPRDDLLQARRDLSRWLKDEHRAGRLLAARSVSSGAENGQAVLHLEVKGELAPGEAPPPEMSGYPVRVTAATSVWAELLAGFRAILKSRFLKLYLAFSTVTYMMSDPLVFSVLGKFCKTGITSIGLPAFVSHVPWLSSFLANFTKTPEALFGLYMSAAALGGVLASFILIWLRDKDPRSIDRTAGRFEAALEKEGLDAEQLERAGAAVRDAVPETVAAYRAAASRPADAEAFGRDVLARALANLNADAFAGKKTPAELEELARRAGLAEGLAAWALTPDARKTLSSGLTLLERQGRWTSILHGAGWLLFWGVFGTGNLWYSVLAMIASAVLQGPAVAVWSSLVTESLRRNHRQQQGRIYSAISFYALVFGIAGPFLFGGLLTFAAAHPAINVLRIALWVITAMAALDLVQAWKNFPMETRRRKA